MLSKTDLCASEPKYNAKAEFGIKRNNSFVALQACLRGGWGVQGNAGCRRFLGFYRNRVCAASLLGHSRGGARFLKRKAKKRKGEVCGREEIGYFKTNLC